MNPVLIAALASLVLILSAAFTNAYKIAKHQVEPTLSSWLIFLSATSTSFITYLASSNKAFVAGTLNGADVMGDIIVIFTIIFFGAQRWKLKPFEKYYLLGLIVIILFWALSRDSFHSNLLIQTLLVVGYFPTAHSIIKLKRNTESFTVWGLILLASIISLYPSYQSWQTTGNILSFIYSLRSVVLLALLLLLMFTYKKPYALKN